MEVTGYEPGMFCWSELTTSDSAGAKSFYSQLFGWESIDFPMGEGAFYTMLKLRGKDVAALYQDNKEGIPPHWGTYVTVADVEAVTEKAKSLGGVVIAGPFDVMDVGRMSVIQDPTGAVLHAWQPKAHFGASIVNEAGAACWRELATRDKVRAIEFYGALFGWKISGDDYAHISVGDNQVGGIMQITPEMGPVPTHWLTYFMVDDLDASVQKAAGMGATTYVPPREIPNTGRFAVIADPQGAAFALFTPAPRA